MCSGCPALRWLLVTNKFLHQLFRIISQRSSSSMTLTREDLLERWRKNPRIRGLFSQACLTCRAAIKQNRWLMK
jgi:hypothetical protein